MSYPGVRYIQLKTKFLLRFRIIFRARDLELLQALFDRTASITWLAYLLLLSLGFNKMSKNNAAEAIKVTGERDNIDHDDGAVASINRIL